MLHTGARICSLNATVTQETTGSHDEVERKGSSQLFCKSVRHCDGAVNPTGCFSRTIFFKRVWHPRAQCTIPRHQLYLGVGLHLTDEAVGGQAEFGNACVPDVFDQRADFVCFRDVVGRTADTHKPPCKLQK